MAEKTFIFRSIARIVAIIFAVCFSAFFLFAVAFATRPWPLIDQIVGGLSVLFIIGLLLGIKWPVAGALLTFVLPVFEIVHILSSGFSMDSLEIKGSILFNLILLIPGILYLLSWYFQVQRKK